MSVNKSGKIRIPPQDIEAEKALLGSIMLRPDMLSVVIDSVEKGSFYLDKHNSIYTAMIDLYAASSPIDLVSVSSKLGSCSEFIFLKNLIRLLITRPLDLLNN